MRTNETAERRRKEVSQHHISRGLKPLTLIGNTFALNPVISLEKIFLILLELKRRLIGKYAQTYVVSHALLLSL